MELNFGYQTDPKDTTDLYRCEVIKKAMNDKMLYVDSYGNIVDRSKNEKSHLKKESFLHHFFNKK